MICALCLREGRRLLPDPTEPLAAAAITVANGHALCRDHFAAVADWQTEDAGTLSLHASAEVAEQAPDDTSELDG